MAATSAFSREKLFEIARTLPAAPRVLASLSELLQDLNVGLDEVANLIKRDASLATRIIRISNSVVYGGSGGVRIGAIDEAVNRVGFSEVYRLVGLVASDRLSERNLQFYGVGPQTMREHMLFSALAAEMLAEECGLDPRHAYTAGLLRTIGMLVLDRVAERLTGCEVYDHARFGTYLAWEGVMFGVANTEVAGMVLTDWRFPSEIVSAIRDHYLSSQSHYQNRFACLLNVSGRMVGDAGHALPGDRKYWEFSAAKDEVLGVTEEHIQRATDRAHELFERLRTSLS